MARSETLEAKEPSELSAAMKAAAQFFYRYIATIRFALGAAALICVMVATKTWLSIADNASSPAQAKKLEAAAVQGTHVVYLVLAAIVFLVILVRASGQTRREKSGE